MAAEEDILLREVDEDLKQDRTVAFFKQYGPWLGAMGALIVVGVGVVQYSRGAEARANAKSAEIYDRAVAVSDDDPTVAVAALSDAADRTNDGYAALARLREAAFLVQDDRKDDAIATLEAVYADKGLPARVQDLARLRAANLLLDDAPARAASIAGAVTTPAMKPLADELVGLAALAQGDYEAAYATFSELAQVDVSRQQVPGVLARARLLAPVADAGRRGVSLEPEETEAEAFIRSFAEEFEEDLSAVPEDDGAQDDGDSN